MRQYKVMTLLWLCWYLCLSTLNAETICYFSKKFDRMIFMNIFQMRLKTCFPFKSILGSKRKRFSSKFLLKVVVNSLSQFFSSRNKSSSLERLDSSLNNANKRKSLHNNVKRSSFSRSKIESSCFLLFLSNCFVFH